MYIYMNVLMNREWNDMGLVPYNSATIPIFCATPIIYQDVNNPSKYMCGFQMFSYLRLL